MPFDPAEGPGLGSRTPSGWSWTKGQPSARAVGLELLRLALAAVLVVSVAFVVFEVWTISPALSATPRNPRYARFTATVIQVYALDQPLLVRYGVWVGDMFSGNLGPSYVYGSAVSGVVLNALPVTLELVLSSWLWALGIGGALGWAASSRRFPRLGILVDLAGWVLYALPVFLGVLTILVWAGPSFPFLTGFPILMSGVPRVTGFFTLDALLAGDLGTFEQAFVATAVLTLPVGLAFAHPVLRRVHDALRARRDAPEFAALPASHGLPLRVALRTPLPALASSTGLLLPFLFGGGILAEILTYRRGVGWLLLMSVSDLDWPLLVGAVVLPILVVIVMAAPFTLLAAYFDRTPAPSPSAAPSAAPAWSAPSFRTMIRARALPFWAGVVLLAVPLAITLAAPVLAPLGPQHNFVLGCVPQVSCPSSPPNPAHPLGIDRYGRDVWAEVVWGGWPVLGAVTVGLSIAAGLALALGIVVRPLGRAANLLLAAVLGAAVAAPVFLMVWMLSFQLTLPMAVALAFVPIVFRDLRVPAEWVSGVGTEPGPVLGLRGWAARAEAAGRGALPTFLVRLPRRAAEIALLTEGVLFLNPFYGTPSLDWAGIASLGYGEGALVQNNFGWVVLPGLLLFLFAAGLFLIADGLRRVWLPELSPPEPVPITPAPAPPPGPEANP